MNEPADESLNFRWVQQLILQAFFRRFEEKAAFS
jgi:hypothetical protein